MVLILVVPVVAIVGLHAMFPARAAPALTGDLNNENTVNVINLSIFLSR